MTPAALVFDFDGLIIDTESVEYASIRRIWLDHGVDLPLEAWLPVVGAAEVPDWMGDLEARVGRPLDRSSLAATRATYAHTLVATLPVRDGVLALLEAAGRAGIPCGIASNSDASWVRAHLARVGLLERFAVLVTVDTVRHGKPDPEPYRTAVAALGAAPEDAVAFEDSWIGLRSAVAAGLATVAVPGPMSALHDLSAADIVVESLAGIDLEALAALLAARHAGSPRP